MTLKCKNCGYIVECIIHNFCPECGLYINNNYKGNLIEQEKDKFNNKTSISKIQNKVIERRNKIYLKLFDKTEISKVLNLKNNIYKITSFSHDVTSNIVNEIKENVDEGFDKIKDKIFINVEASLNSIIKTTSDPNVIMVAKALSKNSPKIAMVISSCALAGLPYGSLITQVAGFAVNQLMSGEMSSTNKNMNMVNSSSITPIIETIVNQLLPT